MFLGLDIGTSAVKAVITAADGAVMAQSTGALSVSRPYARWSEQSPDDWWTAAEIAVTALPAHWRTQVQGIGLAGQMHGATVLGKDDRPLRPAILWNDARSFAECDELERLEPDSRAITGNLAMPGFTAPKLAWMRKHEPDLFESIHCVLLPKDFVRLCMTGDKASDMSDASGTLWLDVAARDWSDVMLSATGLTREKMPALFEGTQVSGRLRTQVAVRWGMQSVPVVAGAGDNAGGAAGVGVVCDGDALLSLGTSGVIFIATRHFRPRPETAVHAFCHCLPGMWHQMSVHLSAASCLDWGARLTGMDVGAFLAAAEAPGPAGGPELFLPFLSGERTPHNDPHVRAALLRADNETDAGRVAAAVLEGVAFAHADGLDALRDAGTQVDQLYVIGGGARSRHWGKILSAALNVPLMYLDGGDVGPALGAARLAQIGVTGADIAMVCKPPSVMHTIEPDHLLAERLAPKRSAYRKASAAIRNLQE